MRLWTLTLGVVLLSQLAGANEKSDRLWWVDKLSRTMKNGQGLQPHDDLSRFNSMTDKEIFEEFAEDPKFSDSLAQFYATYLGFRSDSSFDIPERRIRAIKAVVEAIMHDGSLGVFFSEWQSITMKPLRVLSVFDDEKPELDENSSQDEIRSYRFEKFRNQLQKAREGLEEAQSFFDQCQLLFSEDSLLFSLTEIFSSTGMNYDIEQYFTESLNTLEPNIRCFFQEESDLKLNELFDRISIAAAKWESVLPRYDPESYKPPSIYYEEAINLAEYGLKPVKDFFGSSFFMWGDLQNSSTNFNRRRAAWALKTFFCDDLTPINIEEPEEHGQDRHASEPSCRACHYKLDPMAGFFRNFGANGINFSGYDFMLFDDNARTPRTEYSQNWRAPGGGWNVGYIRDPSRPDLNLMGETMGDLFRILRRAPEVNRCRVERMYTYFVGEQHQVAPGGMAPLAAHAAAGDEEATGKDFKDTLYRLVTSRAFRTRNPDPQECLDRPEGVESPVPCAISYTLKKNCLTCHSGSGAGGGLRLDKWMPKVDGLFAGFSHRENDEQLPVLETFARIKHSLETADVDQRMPLNRYMPAADRARLYRWTIAKLEELQ